MINLHEVEQRCERATEGPWETDNQHCMVFLPYKDEYGIHYGLAEATDELIPAAGHYSAFVERHKGEAHANMDFIAHARTDLPEAVRLIREAHKNINEAIDYCEVCRGLPRESKTRCARCQTFLKWLAEVIDAD